MREETSEAQKPLRSGYTTGACATATAYAAARLLLGCPFPQGQQTIEITLPRGQSVCFALAEMHREGMSCTVGTIKDAGDDPDVTHGALIRSTVRLVDEPGIQFKAGEGVGTITLPGLSLAVGEPAINPVPRRMISEHLHQAAEEVDYDGGFIVEVAVEGGEKLAQKTMNPRLGIVGGLSILGTTGIVRPFSCAAYIASIHQGVDVARENGQTHLAACTGSSSERVAVEVLGLPEIAIIEMGDFAGAFLKYFRRHPVDRLSFVAGFGKLCKLADGHLDLHSRHSSIDFGHLAQWAESKGASESLIQQITTANTSLEAWLYADKAGVDLARLVCEKALAVIASVVGLKIPIEVIAIDRGARVIGRAE